MVILPSNSVHGKTKDRRREKEGMEDETTGKIEGREKTWLTGPPTPPGKYGSSRKNNARLVCCVGQ